MNLNELYEGIAEALAAPVASIDHQDITASEVASVRSDTTAALAQVRELKEQLKAAHPDVLLAQLQRREETLTVAMSTIARAENNIAARSGADPKVEKLTEAIRDTIHNEASAMQAGLAVLGRATGSEIRSLPSKFIRADATLHFRQERDAAEKELAELHRKYPRTAHSGPAGSTLDRMRRLESTIAEWESRTQKLCRLGERVQAIRDERRRLNEERDELQQKHRAKVLIV